MSDELAIFGVSLRPVGRATRRIERSRLVDALYDRNERVLHVSYDLDIPVAARAGGFARKAFDSLDVLAVAIFVNDSWISLGRGRVVRYSFRISSRPMRGSISVAVSGEQS
jgi:hypothetical protein